MKKIFVVLIAVLILAGCQLFPAVPTVQPTALPTAQPTEVIPVRVPTRDLGTVASMEAASMNSSDGSTLTGYWWNDLWIPGMPTFETQLLVTPKLVIGIAEFYAPGLMEATARYRGFADYRDYIGTVSLMTAGDIGAKVWLKRPGHDWEGPFLVVDCAKRNDLYGIVVYNKEVVEVDFQTAIRWGMVMKGYYVTEGYDPLGDFTTMHYVIPEVLVSKVEPDPDTIASLMPPVKLSTWFLDHVIFQKSGDYRRMDYLGGSNWLLGDVMITTDPNNP